MSAIAPHLFTGNLRDVVGFYTGALGFTLSARHPEGDDYTWCTLTLGGADLMFSTPLSSGAGAEPLRQELASRYGRPGAVVLYVEVPDVDAQHERAVAHGVRIVEPIWDAWWGLRQFTVADPEGNLLAFHTPLRKIPAADA